MAGGETYFGTAGWSYPDWKGTFYPEKKPRGFDELAYLSGYFDCVEVNSTFYRFPDRETVGKWVERVAGNPDFLFTFKLHHEFTHGPEAGDLADKAAAFSAGLAPAAETGRLGVLLAQFPWSFQNTGENRARIAWIAEKFGGWQIVVEVRHASWDSAAVIDFLRKLNLGFCNIDQPVSKGSMGMTRHFTESVGYFRLHGRNAKSWFKGDSGRDEKYNYLYSRKELEEWVPAVAESAKAATRTFVIGNNHFKGQAPANILQLKSLITGDKVRVPAALGQAYPLLGEVAETE